MHPFFGIWNIYGARAALKLLSQVMVNFNSTLHLLFFFFIWSGAVTEYFVFQQEHIYKLMKSDSYSRFIRSSAYQELLQAKKKVQTRKSID